jgi:hypothetical protein
MAMSPRLLRPRAPGGFNPKTLPGLKIWLDAANSSSLTFNGGDVSQMNDLSGNGFHATQSTGANQPTLLPTGFNGKPTLDFDTTDSLVSSATIADYFLTPTTSPTFVMVMACYMPTIVSSGGLIFGSDAQANGRLFFASHFGGSSVIYDTVNASGGRVSSAGQTDAGWTAPHILTVLRNGATMSLRRNGVEIAGKTNASGNFTTTTAKLQIGKCDGGASNVMYLSEMLAYASALSASQIAAAERGLARKWGIALAPTATNADAQAWINNVYLNGGTVSTATANAVNTFCTSIESAGIRDRFYRLNLFAGSNLSAALVPLYRGQSLGGTQFGNTTDTNTNFVSGDYVETGATGGLKGNGSNKSLNTGLLLSDLPSSPNGHISAWAKDQTSARSGWIVAWAAGFVNGAFIEHSAAGSRNISFGRELSGSITANSVKQFLVTRSSTTDQRIYQDGSLVETNTSVPTGTQTANAAVAFQIFARRVGTSVEAHTDARMNCYSIGDNLSGAQVTSFRSALTTFFDTLSRT